MLTQTLWWFGIGLIVCILARAIKGGFFKKYLVFYVYLSYVLSLTLFKFYLYVFRFRPGSYRTFYWYTEFLSVAIGYCVIWEVYGHALSAYPGTLRMARRLVIAIFVMVAARAFANSLAGPIWGSAETVLDLERNLRTVQAVLLLVIVAVVTYYMIPIGQNLRGIILGYGFFIGTLVINNTLWSTLGDTYQKWLQYSQTITWLITSLIWSAMLWSYHPNPTPESAIEIERDYERLSARTAQNLAKVRGYLLGTVRS